MHNSDDEGGHAELLKSIGDDIGTSDPAVIDKAGARILKWAIEQVKAGREIVSIHPVAEELHVYQSPELEYVANEAEKREATTEAQRFTQNRPGINRGKPASVTSLETRRSKRSSNPNDRSI